MTTLTEVLDTWPALAAALAILIRLGLAYQDGLSWPEYRLLHGIKRLAFPLLQRTVPVTSWINEKSGRDDAEFIVTQAERPRRVVTRLRQAGGSLHLIASVKRRPPEAGDPLSLAHLVWLHDDGTQTECYIFANSDGTTDIYAHHEPSPARPLAHLGADEQVDGDVRDVLPDAVTRDLPDWLPLDPPERPPDPNV